VLGCGYAGVLYAGYHVPPATSVVAGAMCGFSGMLPDLDSDYGVPLRETMAFTAATIPMLLVGHFESLRLSHDAMILAAITVYLTVRFGVTNLIRKYTVHRGMFHSIPAMLIFAGLAFLMCGTSPFEIRCIKAGGVMAGFMSHLMLDELYSIEFKGGRWRLKKSFGTAIKFWGDDAWSNFSTYAKLAIVAMFILGEPAVMQRLEADRPQFAAQLNDWRDRINAVAPQMSSQGMVDAARSAVTQLGNATTKAGTLATAPADHTAMPAATLPVSNPFDNRPTEWQWSVASPPPNQNHLPAESAYGTAQRPAGWTAQ
jgi:hypothetical protein